MYTLKVPLCGAVTRYLKVYAPLLTLVAGQSARARSIPLNAGSLALHSLPSGISSWCLPAALPMRMPFQSYSAWVPPAATAALHAADFGFSGPSAWHCDTRLTGSPIEPCADAGAAARVVRASGARPATATAATLRGADGAGMGNSSKRSLGMRNSGRNPWG